MTPSQKRAGAGASWLSDRDVGGILTESRRQLIDDVLIALATEIEVYGSLPAEALTGDIAAAIERGVDLFVSALVSSDLPQPAQLGEVRHSAARRAEERIPLDMMVRAYTTAARALFDRVTEHPSPADIEGLRSLVLFLFDFLSEVIAAATTGYLDEYRMIVGTAQSARERLLDALLEGTAHPTSLDTEFHDTQSFTVIALAIGQHDDERQADVDAAIAARRKLRRVRAELDRLSGDRQLSSLRPDGGIAIIANTPRSTDASSPSPDLAALVAALAEAAEVPITAACAPAGPDEIPAAVDLAKEILVVAQRAKRPPRLYELDDVLLEFQVSRPGPARDALAGLLGPLEADPDLLNTLRCFLDSGQNRRRTALDLHIHPNTVDYRNAKITRLTHLDPTDAHEAFQLRVALMARDADHGVVEPDH